MHDLRKFAGPVFLAALIAFAWVGTSVSPLRENSLDVAAQRYVDDGLKRALVTFASARTVNAVLSTVQGTTLAVEPFGIGVQLSVGQALHPLNQIVGQFADWMLAASVAFGVMEVMVRMGSAWPLTAALTLAAVGWGAWYWKSGAPPLWLVKILLILVILRFAVPFVSLGSEWAYIAFLSDEYSTSQAVLSASASKVSDDSPPHVAPTTGTTTQPDKQSSGGLLGWLTSKFASSPTADAKPEPGAFEKWKSEATSKITNLGRVAESLTEHVVKLMAVFLLQTLVFPVLLLWLVVKIGKGLFAGFYHDAASRAERR